MRELVMRYLSNGLTRRGFLQKMAAAGFSTVAAKAVLESLSPLTAAGAELAGGQADGYKTMQGTVAKSWLNSGARQGRKFVVVAIRLIREVSTTRSLTISECT